jgi:hypothetical protein
MMSNLAFRTEGRALHENGVCISTNSVEGFFGILKRGINGVYHQCRASAPSSLLDGVRLSVQHSQGNRFLADGSSPKEHYRKAANAPGFTSAELGSRGSYFRKNRKAKDPLAGGSHRKK